MYCAILSSELDEATAKLDVEAATDHGVDDELRREVPTSILLYLLLLTSRVKLYLSNRA